MSMQKNEATDKIQALFASKLVVVNVGPKLFADALEAQGVTTVQVDWRPMAEGDKEAQELLKMLGGM